MKKTLFLLMTGSIFTVLILSSCEKDNNDPPKTKTQLITQASWKFKGATIDGSDASAYIQACQKDNILVFVAAGTGDINEGNTKCNLGDPPSIPFTWTFTANETVLNASAEFIAGGGTQLTIQALNETQLVLSMIYSPPVGPIKEMIVTFEH